MRKRLFKRLDNAPVFSKQASGLVEGKIANKVFREFLDNTGYISFLQDALSQLIQGHAVDNPVYKLLSQFRGAPAAPDIGGCFFQGELQDSHAQRIGDMTGVLL